MVLEERSYQKQYFAKIFPSLLVSTLHIHFYFHLKKSSENALWIAIVLKSATFSASESAPDTALETTYFMLFLKNMTKFGEKADDRICFDRIDQFYTNFLFPACYFFCYWEKFPNHAWLARNCLYEAALLFFPRNTPDCFCLLKIIIRVAFCSNIFTKP